MKKTKLIKSCAKRRQILFGIDWNALDEYDIWHWHYECDNYKKWKEINIYFLWWVWGFRVYSDPYPETKEDIPMVEITEMLHNCTSGYYCINEKDICKQCCQETLNPNDNDLFDPDPELNEIDEDE